MAIPTLKLPSITPVDAAKFWGKVDIKSSSECWEWIATKHYSGYGILYLWFGKTLKQYRAHRVAYYLHYGQDPVGGVLLHNCDNPGCANPHHLTIGTQTENLSDMERKGRRAKGEKLNLSKITRKEAKKIREVYKSSTYSQREIGEQFGITQVTVSKIVLNVLWNDPEYRPIRYQDRVRKEISND
jgi:hypothetical protein